MLQKSFKFFFFFFLSGLLKDAAGKSATLLLCGNIQKMVEHTRETNKKNQWMIGFIRPIFKTCHVNFKYMNA